MLPDRVSNPEIRIVGPGKTRGYPYPVCKNKYLYYTIPIHVFKTCYLIVSSTLKIKSDTSKGVQDKVYVMGVWCG